MVQACNPSPEKLRQEDHEFKASLSKVESFLLKKEQKQSTKSNLPYGPRIIFFLKAKHRDALASVL